eukprot:scaffold474_cov169-Ochromonas_danica.AAC.31
MSQYLTKQHDAMRKESVRRKAESRIHDLLSGAKSLLDSDYNDFLSDPVRPTAGIISNSTTTATPVLNQSTHTAVLRSQSTHTPLQSPTSSSSMPQSKQSSTPADSEEPKPIVRALSDSGNDIQRTPSSTRPSLNLSTLPTTYNTQASLQPSPSSSRSQLLTTRSRPADETQQQQQQQQQPSRRGLEVINRKFASEFIVAATERKKRFYPVKKAPAESIEEHRAKEKQDRRRLALERLARRRQEREVQQRLLKEKRRKEKLLKQESIQSQAIVSADGASSSDSESVSGGDEDIQPLEEAQRLATAAAAAAAPSLSSVATLPSNDTTPIVYEEGIIEDKTSCLPRAPPNVIETPQPPPCIPIDTEQQITSAFAKKGQDKPIVDKLIVSPIESLTSSTNLHGMEATGSSLKSSSSSSSSSSSVGEETPCQSAIIEQGVDSQQVIHHSASLPSTEESVSLDVTKSASTVESSSQMNEEWASKNLTALFTIRRMKQQKSKALSFSSQSSINPISEVEDTSHSEQVNLKANIEITSSTTTTTPTTKTPSNLIVEDSVVLKPVVNQLTGSNTTPRSVTPIERVQSSVNGNVGLTNVSKSPSITPRSVLPHHQRNELLDGLLERSTEKVAEGEAITAISSTGEVTLDTVCSGGCQLFDIIDDCYIYRYTADQLPGLSCWKLENISSKKTDWRIDLEVYDDPEVLEIREEVAYRTLHATRRRVSMGLVVLSEECQKLLLGHEPVRHEKAFITAWQRAINLFDQKAVQLSANKMDILNEKVSVCGNGYNICKKIEYLIKTFFITMEEAAGIEAVQQHCPSRPTSSSSSVGGNRQQQQQQQQQQRQRRRSSEGDSGLQLWLESSSVVVSNNQKEIPIRGNPIHDVIDVNTTNESLPSSGETTSKISSSSLSSMTKVTTTTIEGVNDVLKEQESIIVRRPDEHIVITSCTQSDFSLTTTEIINESTKPIDENKNKTKADVLPPQQVIDQPVSARPESWRLLQECMMQCLKLHEEWLEVMKDYSTVFCTQYELLSSHSNSNGNNGSSSSSSGSSGASRGGGTGGSGEGNVVNRRQSMTKAGRSSNDDTSNGNSNGNGEVDPRLKGSEQVYNGSANSLHYRIKSSRSEV